MAVGEANMDCLEKLGAKSENFAIENVIEGIPVEEQLMPKIKNHLKDVILKNIHLHYFSEETEINTTQHHISHWQKNQKESTFLIAGRYFPTPVTAIKITAQVTEDIIRLQTLPMGGTLYLEVGGPISFI